MTFTSIKKNGINRDRVFHTVECPGKPNLLPVCLLICCVFFVAGKHDRFKSVDMLTFEQI